MIRFGPGAARASANRALNSVADIQWCTSTTWRCISGKVVAPPPKASRESWPKISASETSVPVIARASMQ